MNREIFTPRILGENGKWTRRRFTGDKITFSPNYDNSRGLKIKGTITVKATGQVYQIKGAACGLPHCNCDAIAREMDHV
jgi:hypothetical protein